MESYQENERYQNNLSPEPSDLKSLHCYKTPVNYQQTNPIIQNGQLALHNLYPTPPSDNEENSNHHNIVSVDNTPKINGKFY